MTKPVYIINGFLESGKTEFITFTLGQPYFQIKGRTLLILCEEGENEYDPALLKKSRTDVVLIEEEEEFNPNHLIELEKQYKPARIIIEYNGMWNFKNMKLPWYWKVEQQITTIDGSTFPMYYTNMKSLLAEYEIFGTRSYANSAEKNYQAQYAYYSAGNSKVKYCHSATSSAAWWWERSPFYIGSGYFCFVHAGGDATYYGAGSSGGVAPAFRV